MTGPKGPTKSHGSITFLQDNIEQCVLNKTKPLFYRKSSKREIEHHQAPGGEIQPNEEQQQLQNQNQADMRHLRKEVIDKSNKMEALMAEKTHLVNRYQFNTKFKKCV